MFGTAGALRPVPGTVLPLLTRRLVLSRIAPVGSRWVFWQATVQPNAISCLTSYSSRIGFANRLNRNVRP